MDYVALLDWLKIVIDVFFVDDNMSHMIQLC